MRRHPLIASVGFVLVGALTYLLGAGGQCLASPLRLAEVTVPTVGVTVDIKPGSEVNPINLKSQGVIPVAVLSSDTFDATRIDPATVLLAGAGVAVGGDDGRYVAAAEDVNGDGILDLVLHMETEELDPAQLAEGYAVLTGSTVDGVPFEGQDIITIVPGDLADDFWALDEIAACIRAGIVAGYEDDTYRPEVSVTRDQIAVFVSRALAGGDGNVPPGPVNATFADVPADYWAFRYVEHAAAAGVVHGFAEGDFRPTLPADRAQIAAFIARAVSTPADGPDLANFVPPARPTFSDVPHSFWAYKYIEYIASRGIASGYENGTYRPGNVVDRGQMAVYVQRAFQLPV